MFAARGGRELRRNLEQDVVDVLDELRAVPDQFVTTLALRVMNGSRHREDFATVFHRESRRDQRAAAARRLDDERAEAERRDDAVAAGKLESAHGVTGRVLGDDEAVGPDRVRELAIPRGIDDVDTAAGDCNRAAATFDRPAMPRGIDAGRQSARDGEPEPAQLERERPRCVLAVLAGMTAADDRELRFGQERPARAVDPECERRIGDRGESLGITRGAENDELVARRFEPGVPGIGCRESPVPEARDLLEIEPGPEEQGPVGGEDSVGAASRLQCVEPATAARGDRQQFQPGIRIRDS